MSRLASFNELLSKFPGLRELRLAPRRRIPLVRQMSTTECGITCLAMVLRFHGRHVPLETLREVGVSARDATNAHRLVEVGRMHGLRGRVVALDIDQLEYLERGAILHWRFNHFVVLDAVRKGRVSILDPAGGRRFVGMKEFGRSFTGVAILFTPTDTFEPRSRDEHPAWRYCRDIFRESRFFPHILALSLCLQAAGLASPFLTGWIIDKVIPHRDYDLLTVLAIGALALTIFQGLASALKGYLMVLLRTRLDSRMSVGFVDHLLSLPFDFFQRRATGDLLMRVGSNSTVRETLTGSLFSTVLDGTMALSYLIVLFMLSASIGLLTVGLAAIQVLLLVVTRHHQKQLMAESIDAHAKTHGHLVETLGSIESLKSLGAERQAASRWTDLFVSELNISLRSGRLNSVLGAITSSVQSGSSMLLLGAAAVQVLSGGLSLGDMVALTAVANGFLGPVIKLASSGTQLQQLSVHLERLHDVLSTEPETARPAVRPSAPVSGAVCLDDVSFRYGPVSSFAVKNVSLDVKGGQFVAIIGRSGSGKSTLARLLVGLFAPTEGRVIYDGHDLAQLDLTWVRSQVGIVTQQTHLFGGTIRDNITLRDTSLSTEDIIRAAKLAHIHEDIAEMPMGYDTMLLDRGGSLSGGQQQRLALARALVRRPRILLLDEATSHLDATTEKAVQASLHGLECTRVVIAHRLSTILNADTIFVMDRGTLVESGPHAQLIGKSTVYNQLMSAQLRAM